MPATALFLAAWAALTEAAVAPSPDAQIAAALVAAMPADGMTDVVLIDHPATPRAPRVRVATVVRAAPALVKAVLMDPARYKAIIPGLVRYDVEGAPGAAFALSWELEVPLFNLEGRLLVRDRPDGVPRAGLPVARGGDRIRGRDVALGHQRQVPRRPAGGSDVHPGPVLREPGPLSRDAGGESGR